ncbi:MAG: hypothetical protein J7J87_01155 [Candidatus Diapherotrites archaeon]|nr:hypothetical protein [Candidatus Diapherotrites archaeon]
MGNVTIALKGKSERLLRELAKEKYNNKKGALAKVISEALEQLAMNSRRKRAMERQFKWMDKGFEMGKVLVRKREDIYDRET